jgi:hypothetical protein
MRFLSMIRIDETTGQVPEVRQLDGPDLGCKP